MVNTSLFTALSGLRTHQKFIDVVGNNIANVNTAGFWGSRTTFSDLLSFTMTSGTGAYGNLGGQNPMQVGLGTQIGSIDLNTNQGTFMDTGRPLDVALQGKGFFQLTDGNRNYYTRVGTFGIDTDRKMIDLRTGFRVMSSSGGEIEVPAQATIPAQETSTVTLQGNLPATVTGPLAEILSSDATFKHGYAAGSRSTTGAATANTGTFDISGWNTTESFSVKVNEKVTRSFTITKGSTDFANQASVTIGELVTHIQGQLDATGANGVVVEAVQDASTSLYHLQFTTNKLGSSTSIKLDETNTGRLANLGLTKATATGREDLATATTSLNDLVRNSVDYTSGDQIQITGRNASGNTIGDTFVFGSGAGQNGTTVGDLVTFLNGASLFDSTAATGGATAAISNGILTITANEKGESTLNLSIADGSGTGLSSYPTFKVTQDGTGPDTVSTAIDIYDSLGRSHPVTMTLTRSTTSDRVWTLTASVPSEDGSVYSGSETIGNITFGEDGSFTSSDTPTLTFDWLGLGNDATSSQDEDQQIAVNLGTAGLYTGLSMMGDKTSAAATDQDGYAAGELLNVTFESSGALTGYYSNGNSAVIDILRVAVFGNQGGLKKEGETYFTQSPNSDDPILGTAGSGGAGTVVSGVLENSNVDIAEEFVRLIEAQRGFQANARVITTTDQILAELVNIVR